MTNYFSAKETIVNKSYRFIIFLMLFCLINDEV